MAFLLFLLYIHSIISCVETLPIVTGNCGQAHLPDGVPQFDCCPPATNITAYKEFKPTKISSIPVRVRRPAHLVDEEYIEKYKKAMKLMKELPATDPRSFQQQANVHCAYGTEAYEQFGFPGYQVQIHHSWLFFPWHRLYLYFHEKILGKLIGDPTFALPFWNWDTPAGMQFPSLYTDPSSPLYDPNRNQDHQPPTLMDLSWFPNTKNSTMTTQHRISMNLALMHQQMVVGANTTSRFLGLPYRAGDKPNPGAGTLETLPHGSVHAWVGDRRNLHLEDMGHFYSTARDPIFFSHHANIDRLWTLWKMMGARRRRDDYTNPDWLDSSFVFFDENAEPVRVKVKDCLDIKKLGYVYEDVDVLWE
ncbi:Polyphenol oxidase, chloroplastic [Linum perenne]